MRIIATLALITLCFGARAELRLPSIFSEGMVLQSSSSAKIWGKCAPGAKVKVTSSWDKALYSAIASKDSLWSITMQSPKASSKRYTIVVSSGKQRETISNVLSGEVWFCAGQSNMEMPMQGNRSQPIEGSINDILRSTNNDIRCFLVQRQSSIDEQFDCRGEWLTASPSTTGRMSAVGYHFARLLNQVLGVPVAIVHSNWGGSMIEAWMPTKEFEQSLPAQMPVKVGTRPNHTPTMLYNGMINPLAGYAIKGVLWYQGESNRLNYMQYEALFAAMHKGWQRVWGIGEFPIYFCQIAPNSYDNPDGVLSGYMYETQAKIARNQPNTAMAVLTDTGEINCIHPARKSEAGQRLCYIALAKSYGMNVSWRAPEFVNAQFNDSVATVNFDLPNLGVGPINLNLEGFELAGEDRVFHPAVGRVTSYTLKVRSPHVKNPVAVRYCFRNWTQATLFGANNLPVSPFRSDDWPYEEPKKDK